MCAVDDLAPATCPTSLGCTGGIYHFDGERFRGFVVELQPDAWAELKARLSKAFGDPSEATMRSPELSLVDMSYSWDSEPQGGALEGRGVLTLTEQRGVNAYGKDFDAFSLSFGPGGQLPCDLPQNRNECQWITPGRVPVGGTNLRAPATPVAASISQNQDNGWYYFQSVRNTGKATYAFIRAKIPDDRCVPIERFAAAYFDNFDTQYVVHTPAQFRTAQAAYGFQVPPNRQWATGAVELGGPGEAFMFAKGHAHCEHEADVVGALDAKGASWIVFARAVTLGQR